MSEIYTDPPQSRNEAIIKATIDGTEYTAPPQSRMEDLLLELKEAIEHGGGGGGTSDYTQLTNKPQVNGVTLVGNKTSADLGLMPTRNIDLKPTKDSRNFVFSGGVYEADEKIKSSVEGMDTVYTEDGTPVDLPSYDVIQETEMQFVPTQDLHGYDKPWAGGAGKNLLPLSIDRIKELNTSGTWTGNTYTINSLSILVQTDAADNVIGIQINGTASADSEFRFPHFDLIAGTYILNGTPNDGGGSSYRLVIYNHTAGAYAAFDNGSGAEFTISATSRLTTRIDVYSGISTNVTFYPMIRLSTETDADFEPYSNICPISGQDNATLTDEYDNKYIASLGGTYYGGRVFFENSGFIETIKSVNMSSLTWQRSRSGGFAAEILDAEIGKKFLVCSILSPLEESFSWANFDNYPDNSISYNGGEGTGNKNVYVKCMSCDTLEEFQTLIANQQLAYKLFTAITHRITVTREPLSHGEITYNGSALYISYQKDNVIGECKKFTIDEIAKYKPFNYSTQEKIVGEWVDGKAVYQKTIDLGSAISMTSETSIKQYLGGLYDEIESFIMAFATSSANNSCHPVYLQKVDDDVKLWLAVNADSASVENITIQYTKI